jgi:dihydrofolate reductase
VIRTALSVSLDGFIARHDGGAAPAGLHDWGTAGETRSRVSPSFTMARPSAEFSDEGVAGTGSAVAGRRTYDKPGAWAGRGPVPALPLAVFAHPVPAGNPPCTFVTDGIEAAAGQGAAICGPADERPVMQPRPLGPGGAAQPLPPGRRRQGSQLARALRAAQDHG